MIEKLDPMSDSRLLPAVLAIIAFLVAGTIVGIAYGVAENMIATVHYTRNSLRAGQIVWAVAAAVGVLVYFRARRLLR